jgi:hypothetical protein
MSIIQYPKYNGKVVTNISLTQPSPIQGAKKEFGVWITFDDGTSLKLKSESAISWEEIEK